MNFDLFKNLSNKMLGRHYGLDIDDIGLTEDLYLKTLVVANCRPYIFLSQQADDTYLERIDLKHTWGVSDAPLVVADEYFALAEVNGVFELSEEIAKCPHCGCRTDFDVVANDQQHHRCRNVDCGFEFMAQSDDCDDD